MTEKPLQKKYIDILNTLNLPFIHITNKASRCGVYHDSMGKPCITDFPDLMFSFGGKVYMREFGIEGRHSDRKARQLKIMQWWKLNGDVDIKIINNDDGLIGDCKEIGLIK
jgi:hypothetical protein